MSDRGRIFGFVVYPNPTTLRAGIPDALAMAIKRSVNSLHKEDWFVPSDPTAPNLSLPSDIRE